MSIHYAKSRYGSQRVGVVVTEALFVIGWAALIPGLLWLGRMLGF